MATQRLTRSEILGPAAVITAATIVSPDDSRGRMAGPGRRL